MRATTTLVVLAMLAGTGGLAPVRAGDDATEKPLIEAGRKSLGRAVGWLVESQERDGGWSAAAHGGHANYDAGVTGLAALALARGTPAGARGPLDRALDRLVAAQGGDGMIGGGAAGHQIYNHAIATLALAEGFAITKSERHAAALAKALDFSRRARNPYLGWRYGVRPQDNDTSVTGWMMESYLSARAAGVANPDHDAAAAGVTAWLDKVTEPTFGKVGYTARGNGPARPAERMDAFPADKAESLTAVGIAVRLGLGQAATDPLVAKGLDLCGKLPPRWSADGSIDMYYWYWGSRAMAGAGGDALAAWRRALVEALAANQIENGSWDPAGPWGADGGRVYSTAISALALAAVLDAPWSPYLARLVLFPPKPLEGAALARVDAWLAGLESDAFDEREAASRELTAAVGEDASTALHVRAALAKATELETRRRLERCLTGTEWLVATLEQVRANGLASDRAYLTSLLEVDDEEIRAAARARLEALD